MALDSHIRVSTETYKALNGKKAQGETFDDVIQELLEQNDD